MFFAHAPTRVHEVHDLHDFSAVHGLQEAVFPGYHAKHAHHAFHANHACLLKGGGSRMMVEETQPPFQVLQAAACAPLSVSPP